MKTPDIVSPQIDLMMSAELARHENELKNLIKDSDQVNALVKLEAVKIQIRFCESEIQRYVQLVKTTLLLDDEENNEAFAADIARISQQASQFEHEFRDWLKVLHTELWELSPTSPLLPENRMEK